MINSTTKQIKYTWHLILPILISLVFGLVLFYIRKDSVWPDGVSYIRIAEHYADLNIRQAVNGYWSPLISWLMTPLIWFRVDPLYSYWIVTLTTTLFGLVVAFLYISKHFGRFSRAFQCILFSAIGITFMSWAMVDGLHPDALSGFAFFFAILCANKLMEQSSKKTALLLGICLATLYFAKAVGFYCSLLILFYISYSSYRNRKPHFRMVLLAACIFLLLVAPWIAAISKKYGHPVITTAASYNMRLVGPGHIEHPHVKINTILEPHYYTDTWAWDDPSFLALPDWKPTEHVRFFVTLVARNLYAVLRSYVILSPLLITCLLLVIFRERERLVKALVISSVLILSAAFSITAYEDRYLVIVAIPIILFGIRLIPKEVLKSKRLSLVTALFFVIFALAQNIGTFIDASSKVYTDSQTRKISRAISSIIPPHTRIAGVYDRYRICYFANLTCVGVYNLTSEPLKDTALVQEMRAAKIKYYIDYYVDYTPDEKKIDLPVFFSATSSDCKIYDYYLDKERQCAKVHTTIYSL